MFIIIISLFQLSVVGLPVEKGEEATYKEMGATPHRPSSRRAGRFSAPSHPARRPVGREHSGEHMPAALLVPSGAPSRMAVCHKRVSQACVTSGRGNGGAR